MNFDRLVLRLDEVSQLVDVRVQDELSSMFQSMGTEQPLVCHENSRAA